MTARMGICAFIVASGSLIVLVAGGGCKRSTADGPAEKSAAPPPMTGAEESSPLAASPPALAHVVKPAGKELRFIELGPGGMKVTAQVALEAEVVDVSWRDATSLFAVDDSGAAYLVQNGAARRLAVPAKEVWRRTGAGEAEEASGTADDDEASGSGVAEYPFRVALRRDRQGGVWLVHCQRYEEGDDDPCIQWVGGRLDDTGVARLEALEERSGRLRSATVELVPPENARPAGSAPAGVSAALAVSGADATLTCQDGVTAVQHTLRSDLKGCNTLKSAIVWPASDARALVVERSIDCGEEGPPTELRHLLTACDTSRVTAIGDVIPGPHQYWIHGVGDDARSDEEAWVVRRGTERIGTLPDYTPPLFRP